MQSSLCVCVDLRLCFPFCASPALHSNCFSVQAHFVPPSTALSPAETRETDRSKRMSCYSMRERERPFVLRVQFSHRMCTTRSFSSSSSSHDRVSERNERASSFSIKVSQPSERREKDSSFGILLFPATAFYYYPLSIIPPRAS